MNIDHARAQVVFTMSYFLLSGVWAPQTIVTGASADALGMLVIGYMLVDLTWIRSLPELERIRNRAVFCHHVGAILAVVMMFALDTVRYSGYLLTLELSEFMHHVLWHVRFGATLRRYLEAVNAAPWITTRFVVPVVAVVLLYLDPVPSGTKTAGHLAPGRLRAPSSRPSPRRLSPTDYPRGSPWPSSSASPASNGWTS